MRVLVPSWLRRRLGVRAAAALWATFMVAISLTIAGIALVLLQGLSVRAGVEDDVRAHAVAAATRLASGASPAEAVSAGPSGFAVLQILDAAGSVLAASPQLTGTPALHPALTTAADTVADGCASDL